jgi:hypothetical protein
MNASKLTGRACRCAACGEYFSRERAFDRHRTGTYAAPGQWQGGRRCLTVAEMMERGWRRNGAGCWTMEPLDSAGRDRMRAIRSPAATPVPEGGRKRVHKCVPASSRLVAGKGA